MKPLCVITGGSSGVGFETAKSLVRRYRLALVYKSNRERAGEALKQLAHEEDGDQAIFQADLCSVDDTRRVVQEIERWDDRAPVVLINCAGRSKTSFFIKDSIESQLGFIQENLFACMIPTHFIARKMYAAREGQIINMSSQAADRTFLGTTSYAAAKSAVEVFTQNLSREICHAGVRVNCIRPGLFRSPMTDVQVDHIQRLQNHVISSEAVVAAIHYLLDPRTDSVSGAIIPVIREASKP